MKSTSIHNRLQDPISAGITQDVSGSSPSRPPEPNGTSPDRLLVLIHGLVGHFPTRSFDQGSPQGREPPPIKANQYLCRSLSVSYELVTFPQPRLQISKGPTGRKHPTFIGKCHILHERRGGQRVSRGIDRSLPETYSPDTTPETPQRYRAPTLAHCKLDGGGYPSPHLSTLQRSVPREMACLCARSGPCSISESERDGGQERDRQSELEEQNHRTTDRRRGRPSRSSISQKRN